ncbi:hypothetical protein GRI72_11240 [Altererythrobacter marinus]|uniref:Peptidase E n=1 Tax=Pelagerythrobacter marinus TaxID=538382 RepID=A0ABW9UYZ4_9SPHN|nr:hypothetical protein [Pelagerythrobacter marinus]
MAPGTPARAPGRNFLAISDSSSFFVAGWKEPACLRYLVEMAGVSRPTIVFVGAANGDCANKQAQFFRLAERAAFVPRTLSLFALADDRPETFFAGADAIYVDGGSTRNLIALMREWGADRALIDAYRAGVPVAGASAGANLMFEWGADRFRRDPDRSDPGPGRDTGNGLGPSFHPPRPRAGSRAAHGLPARRGGRLPARRRRVRPLPQREAARPPRDLTAGRGARAAQEPVGLRHSRQSSVLPIVLVHLSSRQRAVPDGQTVTEVLGCKGAAPVQAADRRPGASASRRPVATRLPRRCSARHARRWAACRREKAALGKVSRHGSSASRPLWCGTIGMTNLSYQV